MSEITTHVLDTSLGRPAAGIAVILEIEKPGGHWKELSRGATDGEGRLRHLLAPGSLVTGIYRLTFETREYFAARKLAGFYPEISIVFEVLDAREHYHVPLLLSPFGYSTYRGS
ncbi:MAG: hydroxyisourate hydrolase [Candidatus Acidiferrales bacterium]